MIKRITLLQKLIEENKLNKLAQEVIPEKNEVDPTTADQMAEQIFDKLFDEMVEKIGQ